MDEFDIEMTYRTCSQVYASSFTYVPKTLSSRLFHQPLPFEAKESAVVAVMDKDCVTLSRREEVLRDLVAKGVQIEPWGRCLSGFKGYQRQPVPDRTRLIRKYKFCIAMETSLTQDYVTEELWEALEAGCIPLYLGAPNVKDFLPAPESIINLGDPDVRKSIGKIIKKLSRNSTAYNAHMAWKKLPLNKQSQGFQRMVAASQAAGGQRNECRLCQLVMLQRITAPPVPTYTHCLRNTSWLKAQRTNSSSWGPGTGAIVKSLQQNMTKWWPHTNRGQWSAKTGFVP